MSDCIDEVDVEGAAHRVLFYADGTVRFEHQCTRGGRGGGPLRVAPEIDISLPNGGHKIVSTIPLTITPSILCTDCGTHGFVTAGRWVGN